MPKSMMISLKFVILENLSSKFIQERKPLFLYQDDNDYTYVSLVRHLPSFQILHMFMAMITLGGFTVFFPYMELRMGIYLVRHF